VFRRQVISPGFPWTREENRFRQPLTGSVPPLSSPTAFCVGKLPSLLPPEMRRPSFAGYVLMLSRLIPIRYLGFLMAFPMPLAFWIVGIGFMATLFQRLFHHSLSG